MTDDSHRSTLDLATEYCLEPRATVDWCAAMHVLVVQLGSDPEHAVDQIGEEIRLHYLTGVGWAGCAANGAGTRSARRSQAADGDSTGPQGQEGLDTSSRRGGVAGVAGSPIYRSTPGCTKAIDVDHLIYLGVDFGYG